jgi:hypothetical protein
MNCSNNDTILFFIVIIWCIFFSLGTFIYGLLLGHKLGFLSAMEAEMMGVFTGEVEKNELRHNQPYWLLNTVYRTASKWP